MSSLQHLLARYLVSVLVILAASTQHLLLLRSHPPHLLLPRKPVSAAPIASFRILRAQSRVRNSPGPRSTVFARTGATLRHLFPDAKTPQSPRHRMSAPVAPVAFLQPLLSFFSVPVLQHLLLSPKPPLPTRCYPPVPMAFLQDHLSHSKIHGQPRRRLPISNNPVASL
jgi:hypothetical protein